MCIVQTEICNFFKSIGIRDGIQQGISFELFLLLVENQNHIFSAKKTQTMYCLFDRTGKGYITEDDFKQVSHTLLHYILCTH
jgi:Ca2+-binding EF-hand superfamily protein